MKRLCVVTAVLVLIALPAVGLPVHRATAAPQHATITIRFVNWASAETATSATIGKVIKDFEAKHPSVKIVSQPVPFDQMYQQLITQASAGNLADVQQLNGPWTAELAGAGALTDLSPLAGQAYLNDNWPGGLDAGKYKGKIYSVPYILTPHAFWYNKKLMKQAGLNPNNPPHTLAQLNADLPILKAKLGSKGIYPIGVDTTRIDYSLTQFFPYFYMFGAYPLYGGKPGFNTAGVARALTWLRTIVKKGYTPVGQQIKEERDLMAKGKIVFKLDGPYFVGILQSLNPALNGDKNFYSTFGVTTVPVGYNGKSQTLADIHQLGIAANSKNKAMDWTFIKYLTSSSDSVRTYMLPQGGVPPLKTEDREPVVLKEPVNRIYLNKILRTMVGGPYTPKYGQQLQIILQALQEAALTSTPISQIQSTTQSALAKTM